MEKNNTKISSIIIFLKNTFTKKENVFYFIMILFMTTILYLQINTAIKINSLFKPLKNIQNIRKNSIREVKKDQYQKNKQNKEGKKTRTKTENKIEE